MAGNLKTAFDSIRAEDHLRSNTLLYLQNEIRKRKVTRSCNMARRFTVALASVAVILLSGMLTHSLYFTASTYVNVDINPSVELTLNMFNKIIGVRAYNEDGEDILLRLSLKHKNYGDALIALIDAINQEGYIRNDGLVSVTLQTNSTSKEGKLLRSIQTGVADYMTRHHNTTKIDIFSVSGDTQNQAHELNISPAKYLAIQALKEVAPAVTVEGCRSHSISEIRQMTLAHMDNHHGDRNVDNDDGLIDDENVDQYDKDIQNAQHNNDRYGESDDNGHHGGDHERY